ncbi:fibroleukin-like protein [Sarcoptes scabiei]|uniref:Fibroleukin-like protein n=1 Tax=Sarcoptes scabiei TaxID=52283 RepID=A0A131ZUF9_SARSC|nr:fibroleukin-like protein [Sarcoptes scabiei]
MYNIHQQTYQVCKDALVLPKEVPNCPTMNAICSMLRQYGRKDSTPIERQAASSSSPSSPTMSTAQREKPSVRLSVGSRPLLPVPLPSVRSRKLNKEKNFNEENQDVNDGSVGGDNGDDIEGKAMQEIFGLFANWTLSQYVSRMHRNVAEELNIFSFELKERLQHLYERFNKIDTISSLNDRISSSILEIREQVFEDHDLLKNFIKKFEIHQQETSKSDESFKRVVKLYGFDPTQIDRNSDRHKNITNHNRLEDDYDDSGWKCFMVSNRTTGKKFGLDFDPQLSLIGTDTKRMEKIFENFYKKFISFLNDSILISPPSSSSSSSSSASASSKFDRKFELNPTKRQAILNLSEKHHESFSNKSIENETASLSNANKLKENLKGEIVGKKFIEINVTQIETENKIGNQRKDSKLGSQSKTFLNETIERPVFEPEPSKSLRKNSKESQPTVTKCSRDIQIPFPRSCDEIRKNGGNCNGVYVILTKVVSLKHVYCHMEQHNDVGWIILLRRGRFATKSFSPSTQQSSYNHYYRHQNNNNNNSPNSNNMVRMRHSLDFNQNYDHYRSGFGDMHTGEFWIGLDFIHQITYNEPHLLQIDLLDYQDQFISMVYDGFRIGGYKDGFRFYINNVRDDLHRQSENSKWNLTYLARSVLKHNRTIFTTYDHLYDEQSKIDPNEQQKQSEQQKRLRECIRWFGDSGWWFHPSTPTIISSLFDRSPSIDLCRHLNTFQLTAPLLSTTEQLSIKWNNWNSDNAATDDGFSTRPIKAVLMKIRSEQ